MEGLGHGHGLLADHGIDHEQRFRAPTAAWTLAVADERLVDLEPTGGIEDLGHVAAGLLGLRHRAGGDVLTTRVPDGAL